MKNLFEKIGYQKGDTAFVRVLLSWRLWLIGALMGGILGIILFFVLPTKYTTFSTVIVDHNREQAWVTAFDKELFYFYDVENRKLEAIANGDDVLQTVVTDVPEVSVLELRDGMLSLVKQYDGIWEFHVTSDDAELSQTIAKVWAEAFTNKVMSSLKFEAELEEARAKFLLFQSETVCEVKENNNVVTKENWTEFGEAENLFKEIVLNSEGISPYVEIVPVSVDNLIVREMPTKNSLLFAGVVLGIMLTIGMGLILLREED